MIAPDMATMLSFIHRCAVLRRHRGDRLLAVVDLLVPTIDGDTSTSDTLIAFATGAAAARRRPRAGDRS
jgi:glutamate N-acetyltransferase/amino-acid N-acetyltransferase